MKNKKSFTLSGMYADEEESVPYQSSSLSGDMNRLKTISFFGPLQVTLQASKSHILMGARNQNGTCAGEEESVPHQSYSSSGDMKKKNKKVYSRYAEKEESVPQQSSSS